MEYRQEKCKILKKEQLNKSCCRLVVKAEGSAAIAQPGQFAHIKLDGFFLRRPISICEIDSQKGELTFVFEIRGEGTEALAEKSENDFLDILAPLGKGFTLLSPEKNAAVIGGGIGTPPMIELAKRYNSPTAIIGFRNADAVILKDDFGKIGDTILCTDDGSDGEKGFVSDALKRLVSQKKLDIIYACGPSAMLKAVVEIAQSQNIRCEVSLEERMGCGVGACLVCACKTVKDGKEFYSHVCKDGPVFKAEEVVL